MIFSTGYQVPFPDRIVESYEIKGNSLRANVSYDNLWRVLLHFINAPKYAGREMEPLFFFMELPASYDREKQLNANAEVTKLHKDVYYLDNLQADSALAILQRSGELLLNDGTVEFGFGRQFTHDEIICGKYNVVTIWAQNPSQYEFIFEGLKFPRIPQLVTAWDTFTQDHPGKSTRVEIDGKSVFSLIEEYEPYGLYLAETRED